MVSPSCRGSERGGFWPGLARGGVVRGRGGCRALEASVGLESGSLKWPGASQRGGRLFQGKGCERARRKRQGVF